MFSGFLRASKNSKRGDPALISGGKIAAPSLSIYTKTTIKNPAQRLISFANLFINESLPDLYNLVVVDFIDATF